MIKSLKDLEVNCNETTFEKILSQVEQSIPIEYTTSICTNFKANGFYRARSHNCIEGNIDEKTDLCKAFLQENEFWNVPENLKNMIEIGRCNLEGESMFYCSTDNATAILEAKPKNNYISVASFELKNPKVFLGSKINFIGRNYLSKIPSINNITKLFEEFRDQHLIDIDYYLDELFHRDIPENEEHLYKLSVAVTKCMMKDVLNEQKKQVVFSPDGLIYSSIIRNKISYNIVYRPEHVKMNYFLKKVETFKIIENNDDIMVLRKMRSGFTLESELTNRQINWITDIKDDLVKIMKKNSN